MSDAVTLASSFELLYNIYAPDGLVLVGADAMLWQELTEEIDFEKVSFIDADEHKTAQLQADVSLPTTWQVTHACLHDRSEERSFYYLSDPQHNGLLAAETLQPLWKNLTTQRTVKMHTTTLADVVETQTQKCLVIDCFGGAQILEGAESLLPSIDIIIAQTTFDDSPELQPYTKASLDLWLAERGYKSVVFLEDLHPDVGMAVYVKDFGADWSVLVQKETPKEKLPLAQDKDEFISLQQQYLELIREKELLEKRCSDLETLSTQTITEALQTVETHLSAKITQTATNSTKQLESFINIQNYLASCCMPLNFHGWPISPDIALFLIQKIEVFDYDLIIEFGSGTSTAMFAKAIKNKHKKGLKLVTFEHNKKYYDQTLMALKSQGLESYVQMVYTPLSEYRYEDEVYSYYSCQAKFKKLKKKFKEKKSKVLILVDGPPGATGPLARFPALPHLLTAFSSHKMDLVLDDYDRLEEKTITKRWEALLQETNIPFLAEAIPSEKGLYLCQINNIKGKK